MLQKPYNLQPTGGVAIDGNDENIFSWFVSGDIQTAIEIKIYDNNDNSLYWTLPKTPYYANKYNLPSSTLLNGKEYKWQVTIYNEKNQSISSDLQVFQTSSRPVVSVDPITTVGAPSYQFTATYSQAENVEMRSWTAWLYDESYVLINQTGIQTSKDIQCLFDGLKSEKDYYIEFQVTSSKGLIGTSGRIKFHVLYTQPTMSISLTAQNLPDIAGVQLSWNVIQIIGRVESGDPKFIDGDKLDLRNDRLIFDEGFQVRENFTLRMWIEEPEVDHVLMLIKAENGELSLEYRGDHRFHLFKKMNGFVSHYATPVIEGKKFFIFIQQIYDNINILGESYE